MKNSTFFTENFLQALSTQIENIQIEKYHNKEKTLIKDYPYKNIHIEIKPANTGLFVIWMNDFLFFDYMLLENYLKNRLIHDNANFILISRCIYIYPQNRNNIKECIEILDYATNTILSTIKKIEAVLK